MSKPSIDYIYRLKSHFFVVLIFGASVLHPTSVFSQTNETNREQQIFMAPVPSTDVTVVDTLDQTIVDICEKAGTTSGKLTNACERMFVQVIQSYGDGLASTNVALARAQNQAAEFDNKNREHIAATLNMQMEHGVYLFWLAVLIVLLGVLASAFQFLKVWRQDKVSQTEISVSEKQLSIKTTWIGVVLLGMSMAFFALYLWFVYRISPI